MLPNQAITLPDFWMLSCAIIKLPLLKVFNNCMFGWSLIEGQAIMWKAKIKMCDFLCAYGQWLNTSLFPSSSPYFHLFPANFPGQMTSCATAVFSHVYADGTQFTHAACHKEQDSRCPALGVSNNCDLLHLSDVDFHETEDFSVFLSLADLTQIGQRATITRWRLE